MTRLTAKPEFARTPDNPTGITPLSHTLRSIRKKTGTEIAERIFQLQSELDYRLRHSAGVALTDPTS